MQLVLETKWDWYVSLKSTGPKAKLSIITVYNLCLQIAMKGFTINGINELQLAI